jgi:hemoglobin
MDRMAKEHRMSDTVFPRIPRPAPGHKVGITEETIHDVVHAFYAQIRTDPALGPIFNRVIGQDWDAHLAKMCDFWSSVLLMTGRFKGTPMQAHIKVGGIRNTHFARWLHLFRQTVESKCTPEAAELFLKKAEMIGESLLLGISTARGEALPPKGSIAQGQH